MGAGSVKVMQEEAFNRLGFVSDHILSDHISKINESKTLFDVGLKLGYQHYFDESQNHGIRVGLGIGGGIPSIDLKTSKTISRQATDFTLHSLLESTYKAFSLKTSLEIDYLWDFFNRGNHTIGLDVGLGYEMGAWFGKSTGSATMKDGVDSDIKIEPTKKDTTLLTHTIYPKIGIHYYYGNHQFNVAYKFGGILSGIKTEYKGEFDLKIPLAQTIQSSPSYFSFGYSYRF